MILASVITTVALALKSDAALRQQLAGDYIYPWRVPGKTPLSYITFNTPGEDPSTGYFHKPLTEGTVQLTIWSDDPEKVAQIWANVYRILFGKRLTVLEGTVIDGKCRLVQILKDPGDDTLYYAPVFYEWSSWTI